MKPVCGRKQEGRLQKRDVIKQVTGCRTVKAEQCEYKQNDVLYGSLQRLILAQRIVKAV